MFDRPDLTIACIAAHPDDEVLVSGGSLARHAAAGHAVHILILCTGLESRGPVAPGAIDTLAGNARMAADAMGAREPQLADFPDNRLDTVPLLDVVKRVEDFLESVRPHAVYTHHRGDLNVDHRVVHDAVLTASRPLPGSLVPRILAGEVLSSTEWQSPQMAPFVPTVFHDVSEFLDTKLTAIRAYSGELRTPPHPRSIDGIRAQARLRGVQSGCDAAEAFMLIRECV